MMRINSRILLIIVLTSSLCSCSETLEKLKRVGKTPELANVDIPVNDELGDPKEQQNLYMQRRGRTNSIWQPGSIKFFRDNRSWKAGDILKVVVQISDSAQLNNSSTQKRTGSDSAGFPILFGKEKALAKMVSKQTNPASLLSTNGKSSYNGSGNVNRTEAIQTVIAASVSQVLPNGNLVIQGKQEVRVNYELREVKITGIIRPRDISSDNSVLSSQIAEARISYGGRGIISDVQQPRVGSQIVDIVSPF